MDIIFIFIHSHDRDDFSAFFLPFRFSLLARTHGNTRFFVAAATENPADTNRRRGSAAQAAERRRSPAIRSFLTLRLSLLARTHGNTRFFVAAATENPADTNRRRGSAAQAAERRRSPAIRSFLTLRLSLLARTHENTRFFVAAATENPADTNVSAGFWSRRRGSNPRPQRPERCALPTALRLDIDICLFKKKGRDSARPYPRLVEITRFELVACTLRTYRSTN